MLRASSRSGSPFECKAKTYLPIPRAVGVLRRAFHNFQPLTANQHLTRWFSPAGTIGGGHPAAVVEHVRAAIAEEAALRQAQQRGHDPRDGPQPPAALWRPRTGIDPSSPTVYGFLGSAKRVLASAYSIIRPAYMTATCWDISAITPRSWVMKRIAAPVSALSCVHEVQDLGLDGDVERGRGLVGDHQLAGCRRAPWRSSRAGACRRSSGGGSRRCASRPPGCRPA